MRTRRRLREFDAAPEAAAEHTGHGLKSKHARSTPSFPRMVLLPIVAEQPGFAGMTVRRDLLGTEPPHLAGDQDDSANAGGGRDHCQSDDQAGDRPVVGIGNQAAEAEKAGESKAAEHEHESAEAQQQVESRARAIRHGRKHRKSITGSAALSE